MRWSPPPVVGRLVEWVARARWAFPAVVLLAGMAMVVNEATYQHTTDALRRGIALTDARIEASRTLQASTELEAAARSFAATRDPVELQRFERAAAMLSQSRERSLALVAQVDTGGTIAVGNVRGLIEEHSSRLRNWVSSAAAGAPAAPSDDSQGRNKSAELARELDAILAKAAALQQQARVSLYNAFLLNRGAVHGLIILAVIALVMFGRQLRRADDDQARERERLAEQVRARTAELRDLAGHLVSAREDERGRVARELHDELGGQLTALKLELARLKRLPDLPAAALERLAGFDKRLNEGISLKRRIIENLRPSSLDQLGLTAALEMLCADTAEVSGIAVHTQLAKVALDKAAELSLFRVVQESLTNCLKHAQASEVWVKLTAAPMEATLSVRDNGHGFDTLNVSPGRHGVLGMRVRIESHRGHLKIHSMPGGGTEVIARVPQLPLNANDAR